MLTEGGGNVHAFLEFADNHPIRTPGVDLVRTGARAPGTYTTPANGIRSPTVARRAPPPSSSRARSCKIR
jgi:hypothetical protein